MRCTAVGLVREQVNQVRGGFVIEAGDEGRDASVSLDLRRIEIKLPAPDKTRSLTRAHNPFEEAVEDGDA